MKVPDSYYTELRERLKNSKVKIEEDLSIVSASSSSELLDTLSTAAGAQYFGGF